MGVDDRIREKLSSLRRPVSLDGVLERIAARRARVRRVRRVQGALLAAAVVAGSVTGAIVLSQLFSPTERQDPAAAVEVPPLPVCQATEVTGDIDGDGEPDVVRVLALAPEGVACQMPGEGVEFWAEVIPAQGASTAQPLPECAYPGFCRAIAAPDLNGDGRAEVAVSLIPGATAAHVAFYVYESSDDVRPLHRVALEPPGDPFDPQFGLDPGAALLPWGGSVTHIHDLACGETAGERLLVVLTALWQEEGQYLLHRTELRLEGTALVVVRTSEETVPEAGPAISELGPEGELCGAPVAF
jgi:hypothetical protein